jgi:hypothetical protein
VPLRKPGPYQLRIALRDAESKRIGSATQFVHIPDLSKRRVALSGIVIGARPQVTHAKTDESGVDVKAVEDSDVSPAVRRFRPGAEVSYAFAVYNPVLDKTTGAPDLQTQLRLVRNGQDIFKETLQQARALAPLESRVPRDKKKKIQEVPGYVVGGNLRLPTALEPGEYALQMVVTDRLAKDKKRATTGQWTAFEIIGEKRTALP